MTTSLQCSKCGLPVAENEKFCKNCGEKLEKEVGAVKALTGWVKSHKKLVVIGLSVVVLVAGALIVRKVYINIEVDREIKQETAQTEKMVEESKGALIPEIQDLNTCTVSFKNVSAGYVTVVLTAQEVGNLNDYAGLTTVSDQQIGIETIAKEFDKNGLKDILKDDPLGELNVSIEVDNVNGSWLHTRSYVIGYNDQGLYYRREQ
ncbi:MAG: zinc ribbon domain-containing protein [Coriobacteriia bacterium]|nr:zinc ribbon domain-containing protein [Coriobacteriia bacterium]